MSSPHYLDPAPEPQKIYVEAPRRRGRFLIPVITGIVGLAAGYGMGSSSKPNDAPQAVPTITVGSAPASKAPAKPAATPAPAKPAEAAKPKPAAPPAVEGEYKAQDGSLTLTVTTSRKADYAGAVAHGWKVKACNTSEDTVEFGAMDFMGVDAEGGRLQTSPALGSDAFTPEFPYFPTQPEAKTTPGECLVGWIVFTDKTSPTELRWSDDNGNSAKWKVG